MFGVEVTLQNGSKAVGVLFQDRMIYLHEPISDMWASVADMLEERKDVTGFRVVGPVMPIADARETVETSYQHYLKALEDQRQLAERNYKQEIANLEQIEKLNTAVSFMNGVVTTIKPEPEALGHIDTPGKWVDGDIQLRDGTIVKPAKSPEGSTQAYLCDKVLSDEQRQELKERIGLIAGLAEAA